MAKKKLLHTIGFIALMTVFTATIACNQYTAFASIADSNTNKPEQKYYDEIQSSLKKSGILEEQKKISKEVMEKVKREQDQYKNYGNLQNFSKTDIIKNEKLADQVYQKVKQEEKSYKKIADNVEEKVKKEEAWSKKFVTDANKSIYSYSQNINNQNKNTNPDNTEINDYSQILKNNKTDQSIPDGLYIAVSLSMPKALLVGLSERASKIGAKLIMRGLKNNSFEETVKAIKELSENGIAIDINPKIFRSYEIKQVPAFILITGGKSNILHGNVSLSYVLGEFKDRGDTKEGAKLWGFQNTTNNSCSCSFGYKSSRALLFS